MSELTEIRSDIKDLLKSVTRVETKVYAIPKDLATRADLEIGIQKHEMYCQRRTTMIPERRKYLTKLTAQIVGALTALTAAIWAVARAIG